MGTEILLRLLKAEVDIVYVRKEAEEKDGGDAAAAMI